jgi:hypothetical protein
VLVPPVLEWWQGTRETQRSRKVGDMHVSWTIVLSFRLQDLGSLMCQWLVSDLVSYCPPQGQPEAAGCVLRTDAATSAGMYRKLSTVLIDLVSSFGECALLSKYS